MLSIKNSKKIITVYDLIHEKFSKLYSPEKLSIKSKILEYSNNNDIKYNEFKDLQENEALNSISNVLFKLKINETSEIIETSLAKHILILTDILPANQSELDEVKNEIKDIITKVETQNYYNDLLNQISERIINGETLEIIANSLNMSLRSVKNLTKDYKAYNESEKSLFLNLIQSSFASNKDFVSDIININENLSYVFNVTNIE